MQTKIWNKGLYYYFTADQIDRLGKARYYSSLDIASGFHGIPLAEGFPTFS